MKKHTTLRALAGLLVVLALVFTAGATSAFVGAKPFFLDAPLRFDYIPTGAGNKPILTSDLDGNYVKSVAHANQAITVTLQDGENEQRTLSIPVGASLIGASYSADTETLTLTLLESDPVTADLSGLTTSSEVATAISTAIAAETDAVLTSASYATDSETLTLNLSEGSPVTADLSGVATAAELSSAISAALADVTGTTVTGASFADDTQTLTLTLSEGGPVTADLSGLTTSSEVATAISTAIAAETDAVLTSASYATDSETLTLNLSEGSPVTADLSGVATAAELSSAISAALADVTGTTVTGASFAADTKILTLTLSEGGPVTANLSGLTTSSEVATAISTAIAAETDAVLTSASYATDSETLTLNLSEGSPVTADLSGVATAAELSSAINAALTGVSGVTVTGASYSTDTETLTLTLSEGDPVTADLSGLTTSSEVATAISTAFAAETDAVVTGASFATNTETLTLTLSAGGAVTANLSGLTTTDEVSAAITAALAAETDATVTSASFAADTDTLTLTLSEGDPVTAILTGLTTNEEVTAAITNALAAQTDAAITSASYAADSKLLTLTLSEGEPVTADLSGIATTEELSTAIAAAMLTMNNADGASPVLLGTHEASGATCQVFAPTDIVIPQSGWIAMMIELRNNNGQYVHHYSMPVSLLHDLPVKIDDNAASATVNNNTSAANALTLPVRALSDGYHVGLTTANRLVVRASHDFAPCRVTVYTGPAVVAQSTATVTGASFAPATQVLTLTLSEGSPVTADLSNLTTTTELTAAVNTAVTAVTAVAADAVPADATEASAISVTQGGTTTVLKTPTAALTPSTSDARPDRTSCLTFKPSAIDIPAEPWFFVSLQIYDASGSDPGHSYISALIPRTALTTIPYSVPDNSTTNFLHTTGQGYNIIKLRNDRNDIILGRTPSGKIAWRTGSITSQCTLHVVSLSTEPTPVVAAPPTLPANTTVIWGRSDDATFNVTELSNTSTASSPVPLIFSATPSGGSAQYAAWALKAPSTVTSLTTSSGGGTNLCLTGNFAPCTSDHQIVIDGATWDVYVTASTVTFPADSTGYLSWE